MFFEVFFKAVMSGGFSFVLKKATYFELSCVTVVFQAVCCLPQLSPVSPNSEVFDTRLDGSWSALCSQLVYVSLWWILVIAWELIVRDQMLQCVFIHPVIEERLCLCLHYLSDRGSNNGQQSNNNCCREIQAGFENGILDIFLCSTWLRDCLINI